MLNDLEKRIIDLSYKYHASHIGSCITALPLIEKVYQMKASDEPFILSSGHAGLALFTILEKYEGKNAEELFKKHGTHPNRDLGDGIYCSTGSLGHGIGIALGMAIADSKRNVYCLISDGECMEGSFWEALRIAADRKIENLIIMVNANGYGAYSEINLDRLQWRIASFVRDNCPKVSFNITSCVIPHLIGLEGHYQILDEKMYKEITKT